MIEFEGEFKDDMFEKTLELQMVHTKFKIAVCRLRSLNEVRIETGFDAVVS